MADAIPHGLGLVVYVIHSTPAENAGKRGDFFADHLAFVNGLEGKGVLFAAGPLVDESDTPTGSGMIVVRAGSVAEAEAIAAEDPFHRNNVRQFTVQPWRVNEGTVNIQVSYSDSTVKIG